MLPRTQKEIEEHNMADIPNKAPPENRKMEENGQVRNFGYFIGIDLLLGMYSQRSVTLGRLRLLLCLKSQQKHNRKTNLRVFQKL